MSQNPSTHRSFRLLAFALAALGPLTAHDFWIEPSRYHVKPGQGVALRLKVGTGFQGEAVPRNPALVRRFSLVGPEGEVPALGAEGADPAGFSTLKAPGLHWAVYESGYREMKLSTKTFEKYLVEEGLENIARPRRTKVESSRPVQERFKRCAKALLDADGAAEGFDRVLGLELELVPESDPRKAGGDLNLRLIHRNQPLEGSLVRLQRKGDPATIEARTDAVGRVKLPCPRPGIWLAKAVHAAPSEVKGMDWQSTWASLTFEAR